jgi:hypothetical protein
MALGEQLINRAVDGRAGNGEGAPARTEHRHSGDLPKGINEGTAFARRLQRQVEFDEAVNAAAPAAVPRPGRKRHNAERNECGTILISDCECQLTGSERGGRNRRDGQAIRLESKDCDVGSRVASCEGGLDLASARKREPDVFIPMERFFRRDNDAGTPMNAACRPASAAMNGDDARRDALDELRGVIGKRRERVRVGHDLASGLFLHGQDVAWDPARDHWPDG